MSSTCNLKQPAFRHPHSRIFSNPFPRTGRGNFIRFDGGRHVAYRKLAHLAGAAAIRRVHMPNGLLRGVRRVPALIRAVDGRCLLDRVSCKHRVRGRFQRPGVRHCGTLITLPLSTLGKGFSAALAVQLSRAVYDPPPQPARTLKMASAVAFSAKSQDARALASRCKADVVWCVP